MDSVEKCVGEVPRKKGKDSTHLYYKLFMALTLLREFFYCDGKGIAKEQLDTKKFDVSYSQCMFEEFYSYVLPRYIKCDPALPQYIVADKF